MAAAGSAGPGRVPPARSCPRTKRSRSALGQPFDAPGSGGVKRFRVLAGDLQRGLIIVYATPLTAVDGTIADLTRNAMLIAGIAVVLLGLLLWRVLAAATRPIDSMIDVAARIGAGDFTARVEPGLVHGDASRPRVRAQPDGRRVSSTAFAETSASEATLRQFVADASHELRTPLTSIRGYAQLLRMGAAGDEAEIATSRIDSEAKRMALLLGLGARIEHVLPVRTRHDRLPDEALLAAVGLDEPEAARVFVRRFQGRVFGLAFVITGDRNLAEDVAQQAFERAWRHAGSFDARRGTVVTWLLAIVHNLAVDTARVRRPELFGPSDLLELLPPATDVDPESAAMRADDLGRLRPALDALPVEQRRAGAPCHHRRTDDQRDRGHRRHTDTDGQDPPAHRLGPAPSRGHTGGRRVSEILCEWFREMAPELAFGTIESHWTTELLDHAAGSLRRQAELDQLSLIGDRLLSAGPQDPAADRLRGPGRGRHAAGAEDSLALTWPGAAGRPDGGGGRGCGRTRRRWRLCGRTASGRATAAPARACLVWPAHGRGPSSALTAPSPERSPSPPTRCPSPSSPWTIPAAGPEWSPVNSSPPIAKPPLSAPGPSTRSPGRVGGGHRPALLTAERMNIRNTAGTAPASAVLH